MILKLQTKHFFPIKIVSRRFNVLSHTVINLPSKSANSRAPSMPPHASKSEVGTKTNLDKTEIIAINFHVTSFDPLREFPLWTGLMAQGKDLCQLQFLAGNKRRMSCTQQRSNYRAIDASDKQPSEGRVEVMAVLVGQAIQGIAT